MTPTAVKNVMINRPPRAKQQLTDAIVGAFASQTFVREALANPSKPKHVLSFFFGIDFNKATTIDEMRNGTCLKTMATFWFQRNESYDNLCAKFSHLIHQAGTKAFNGNGDDIWNDTLDGKIAQMLLCDQFARNTWRGRPEAFCYDAVAREIARQLTISLLASLSASSTPAIPGRGPIVVIKDGVSGEVYPPYMAFVLVTLTHSELIEDHNLCEQLFQLAIETTQPHLHVFFEGEQKLAQEHRAVLDKFGRYPHRNATLMRDTTPEEAAWLSDTKTLPVWARNY